jgi:hypothetical protein
VTSITRPLSRRSVIAAGCEVALAAVASLLVGCGSGDSAPTATSSGGQVSNPPSATVASTASATLTLSGNPSTTATTGTPYEFQPSFGSISQTAPTFNILNKPPWASFNTASGQLSGTPTTVGRYNGISISIADGNKSVALPSFSIQVQTLIAPQSSPSSQPAQNTNNAPAQVQTPIPAQSSPTSQPAQNTNNAPAYAAAVGYAVNTFSTTFTAVSVDLANSGKSGFSWYPWNLFGGHTNTAAVSLNADGSITLSGDATGPNGELVTATTADNAAGFVGTAFGGGAYIEAVLKFDPADVARANFAGWPSFWSLAMEGMLEGANQWPGQAPGYVHQIEADFFEYLIAPVNGQTNAYGAAMHDWYGIPGETCPPGLCQEAMPFSLGEKLAPTGTDFTQYHRYGFLWVPATASTPGYARFYLDGESMGTDQRWTLLTDQPPTPTNQPWAFGIIDQQHLVLILGTGVGEPMTIQSVNVWQASAAQNLNH